MERPSDASYIIDRQVAPALKLVLSFICCLCSGCFPKGFWWTYTRAPEPSDIYWQNLGIPTYSRIARGTVSFIATTSIMAVCIGFISLLKEWQLSIKESNATKSESMRDQALPQFLSFVSSATISLINDNLVRTIRRFTDFERHSTITEINVSLAVKLSVARFLNTSVILLLTNKDTKGWFNSASLAYDATILISIMAF